MHPDSPISATLVCWGNAWLTGQVGLDEAADRVERQGGPQLVAAETGDTPLRGFLAELRVGGMTSLRLALPIAGDPLGLTGPPPFNSAAIEAGQAAIAVLGDRCLGMIPVKDRRGSSYAGVRWSVLEARCTAPDLPSLAEAEHDLTRAMRAATDALLGVAGPAQGHRRVPAMDDGLAPGYPARAHRVAALAARLDAALRVADDRGITSGQIAVRAQALRDLDRAVRRARVAAHHAITELV
ncbi:hypothetical protein FHS43_000234 [Streptosporangium becharense]|uniref:Uncharacterized protein n=1 Tax=Streptosporangium becharense TaxID=1816182 RepID=A0A7W9IFY2_9ACTN|nr:hypothetical protein [Streptosporangium becharense]MBB2908988.1 hypothetical protein [Streptosporangium becharense]MBB5819994.1 hypothetical protein [Streptosporangium becharense]